MKEALNNQSARIKLSNDSKFLGLPTEIKSEVPLSKKKLTAVLDNQKNVQKC